LGGTLMDRVLEDVRAMGVGRVYLIVVQDNHVAVGLYQRRGFVRYGERVGDDGLAYFEMVAIWDEAAQVQSKVGLGRPTDCRDETG
jgi:ribosomal protein S18 acetylase RimI-like enzyme